MHKVKLIAIHCHIPDESDLDEIYLMQDGSKFWPEAEKYVRLDLGQTMLNIDIDNVAKGEVLHIEVWDYDVLSKDDKLGTFDLNLDQFGGGFKTEMKKFGNTQASYSLDWEFY